jgi:hypothetical protein
MTELVAMRRKILDVLVYPRQVAMANVDLSACPHSGFFEALDARCQECSKNYECDWLNSTDEFNELAEKPMEFLYRALAFGIDYVDARTAQQDHDPEICECESCQWVRDARNIVRQYGGKPT